MTARLLILIAIACAVGTLRAVDINKVPPMDDSGWPTVELKGRDVEAIAVALQQFRENRFSTSEDLKHFTVEVRRKGDRVAVAFSPESDDRSHLIMPARNKYGVWITYFVSLQTLKIIGMHYERD